MVYNIGIINIFMEPSTPVRTALPTYGSLVNNSFSNVFASPALFTLLAVFALVTGLTSFFMETTTLGGPLLIALVIISVVASILNLVATVVVVKSLANPQANVKDLWRETLPQIWSYWWLMIIYTLATMTGFLLLVIPGMILMGYLSLVLNVAALEQVKGLDAMVRSTELIKGHWWGVSLRTTVVVVIMFLAVLMAGLVFGVLIGTIATIFGFGEWMTDLLSVIILEPVIVAASTIIVFSVTNQIYHALVEGEALADRSKVNLRRLYKFLAVIGPVAIVAVITLISYAYIEYGFLGEEFESLTDPMLYEEVLP